MFLAHCAVCGRRELRGDRSIHSFTTPRGDVLAATCRGCGSELSVASNQVLHRPAAAVA